MNRWITRIGVVLGRIMHCMLRVSAQGLRMAAQAKAGEWVSGRQAFWQGFLQVPQRAFSHFHSRHRKFEWRWFRRRGAWMGTQRGVGMAMSCCPRFDREAVQWSLGREISRIATGWCHGIPASGRYGWRVRSRWLSTVWPSHSRAAKASDESLWVGAARANLTLQAVSSPAPSCSGVDGALLIGRCRWDNGGRCLMDLIARGTGDAVQSCLGAIERIGMATTKHRCRDS